jgi:hypothetical protein
MLSNVLVRKYLESMAHDLLLQPSKGLPAKQICVD